ncbi:MAG: hypothetical protein HYV27_23180 [Candidatus Hydrogenedentes bacterium]|nr:hypothetical protein [Candidatus Hydrogenedentota bacterium]
MTSGITQYRTSYGVGSATAALVVVGGVLTTSFVPREASKLETRPLSAQLHSWESPIVPSLGSDQPEVSRARLEVLQDFVQNLASGMMGHDPKLDALLRENFWDLS